MVLRTPPNLTPNLPDPASLCKSVYGSGLPSGLYFVRGTPVRPPAPRVGRSRAGRAGHGTTQDTRVRSLRVGDPEQRRLATLTTGMIPTDCP